MLRGTVTIRSESKPGSIVCANSRLRRNRPAAINKTVESATCVTTSRLRRLKYDRRSLELDESSFRAGTIAGREILKAGAIPNMIPATKARTEVNSNTRRSIANCGASGRAPAGGGIALNDEVAHQVSNKPSTPPQA